MMDAIYRLLTPVVNALARIIDRITDFIATPEDDGTDDLEWGVHLRKPHRKG